MQHYEMPRFNVFVFMALGIMSSVKTSLFQLSWQIVQAGNKPWFFVLLTNVSPHCFQPVCSLAFVFFLLMCLDRLCPYAYIPCIPCPSVSQGQICVTVCLWGTHKGYIQVLWFVMHVNLNNAKNARDEKQGVCLENWTQNTFKIILCFKVVVL